jgi:CheY-like chemotaxis protein
LRELEEPLSEDNRALSRLIGQFRHELIDLRRVPVRGLFRRLERPARDAARSEGKQIRLVFFGENARIERSLEQSAYEPLLHVVRNAVSHGIETPDERRRTGKAPVGTVTLEARSSASLLVLEVRDDGRGLDYAALERRGREKGLLPAAGRVSNEELLRLIFHPGFSTRTQVSEVSGRGVGMDVVARAIERMGGHVEIDSVAGRGTNLRLSIPLRAGIEHAMLVRVAGQIFAFPLHNVDAANERLAADKGDTTSSGAAGMARSERGDGRGRPTGARGPAARVGQSRAVRVAELLGLRHSTPTADEGCVILNQGELAPADARQLADAAAEAAPSRKPRKFPVLVDSVVGPEEVVVRCLPPPLRSSKLFGGVTLSGAGEIVLLFNVPRLIALRQHHVQGTAPLETAEPMDATGAERRRVLVVDDSLSTRRALAGTLEAWGFAVEGCADGLDALDWLRNHPFDLVLTDIEMPKLGGLELLVETRRRPNTRQVPVIVMTGRGDERVHHRARELGADRFLMKPIHPDVLRQALCELSLLAESGPESPSPEPGSEMAPESIESTAG